jgi:hypothetical protein
MRNNCVRAILTLCLLGGLLTARGQDPGVNPNYPMDTNVCVGATVTIRVLATTTNPPLTYQWQHDETELPRATNAVLIITNVSMADAGGYLAWVSNASGAFTNSRTATLTVYPAQFEDVTVSVGVTNAPGACSGAAWGDYNNDGYIDLYLALGLDAARVNALFRNNGNGTFTRVGAEAGSIATDQHDSGGCAWIDFNNDGYRDLFVLNGFSSPSRNDLYWNNGDGTFGHSYLTSRSWVEWAYPACADYDGDGWVDIYLAEGTSTSGPWTPRLYHNTGSGTFTPVDCLGPPISYANAGAWGDYDNDGDPDLFASNGSLSALWRNDGNGKFTRVNVGLPISEHIYHSAWADFDRDGDLDLAMATRTAALLYRNEWGSNFVQAAQFSNGSYSVPAWADYDNDGNLDLFLSCFGDTPRKSVLYHNNGDGTFSSVFDAITEAAKYWQVCPWGDFDNDGFMDVMVTEQYSGHRLYRNLTNANHWIKFKLVGTASNRDGIGAKVRVQATIAGQSAWQMQEVNGGYAFQNDTRLNFGLGDATNVDLVRIEWPSGNVQELSTQSADRIVTVTEQVLITPVRPTASLGGSVTLNRTALAAATYQWRLDGVDLDGQTNRILNLTNITADMAGRYSVVASNTTMLTTNFVYLLVDTNFTKITAGPVVTDTGTCPAISSGDYDGDGYADLFVCRWQRGTSTVYHNNRDGTFDRVLNLPFGKQTSEIGVWGDLDNDGAMDLLHELLGSMGGTCVSASGYFNNGNVTFTVNQRASVLSYGNRSLVDYNKDGFLDVYYSRFAQNRLYRNNGNRTFTLMTASDVGPVANVTTFGGSCWADFNDDGWPDVYAPHYQGSRSLMFQNDGTGRFVAVSNLVTSTTAPVIVGAWGDYDNDGRLDLCVAAINGGTSVVYRNLGNGEFERPTASPTIAGTHPFAAWADYDNDGFLDLFLAGYRSGNKLFHNNGDGTFTRITTGSIVNELPSLGGGSYAGLWFDYDNDGFLDLYVINGDDASSIPTANQLYHNNGNSNAWLRVKLLGTASNRDGIGAKVRVQATYAGQVRWQRRDIIGGDEDNGNHLTADFGLGNATKVTTLRIEWPSGAVQQFQNVATKQMLTVWEPPTLCGAVRPDGACELTIKAEPNRAWQIQASSDLLTWETLTTVTNTSYQFQFTDPAVAGMDCRFYRVKGQ